jgi:UDP-N-acetylglucosamine diphosphorylase/glucosamine-1-phosphate N-acetyltransferase
MTTTRPAFGLRCGVATLLERQARAFQASEIAAQVRPELVDLTRLEHPNVHANDDAWFRGGSRLMAMVNARWLASGEVVFSDAPGVGKIGDQVAFAIVHDETARELNWQNLARRLGEWNRTLPKRPAGGAMIDNPWDLVERNAQALEVDWRHWAEDPQPHREGVALIGPPERFRADLTAKIEPFVVIDVSNGPVLIDAGAEVKAFSRLEGPSYVGPGARILRAQLQGSTIGPHCRIGGEVERTVVQGYSNKAHEGFLGHSYVGEWVNMGAGTITSDLRNDYNSVQVNVAGQLIDTGLQKVGSFVGDHSRASIGCLFNTGSVIGPFGQLVTAGSLLPRLLPAFCQVVRDMVQERTDLGGMFQSAARMMERRGKKWTEAHAEFFFGLYERTEGDRRRLLQDREVRRLRRVVG